MAKFFKILSRCRSASRPDPLLLASIAVLIGTAFAIYGLVNDAANPIELHLTKDLPRDEFLIALLALIGVGLVAPLLPFGRLAQRIIVAIWMLAASLALAWLGLILPLAAVAFHGFAIFLLGTALYRLVVREGPEPEFWIFVACAFGLGIFGYIIASAVLSLAGAYDLRSLIGLDLLIVAGALVLQFRRFPSFLNSLRTSAERGIRNIDTSLLPIACLGVVCFARANLPPDADSGWYALRWLNRVSDSSIFAPNGYVHFVHYYPKGFELATGWLSGISDPAYMVLFAGALFILLSLAVVDFLSRGQLDRRTASFVAAALLAAPAGLGFGATAKPDTLGVFALILMVIGAVRFFERATVPSIALIVVGAGLCATAKLHYAMYAFPIIVLVVLNATVTRQAVSALKSARFVLPFSAIGLAVICARTYVHTGMLVVGPETAIRLQEAFGLSAAVSYISIQFDALGRGSAAGLGGIPAVLFAPEMGRHLWFTWPGLEWLGLIAVAASQKFQRKNLAMNGWLLSAAAMMLAMAFSFIVFTQLPVYLGDGNYYFAAFVAAALLLWSCDLTFSKNTINIHLTRWVTAVIVMLLLTLVFFSDWGSRYGVAPRKEVARGETLERAERERRWFAFFKLDPIIPTLAQRQGCKVLGSTGKGAQSRTLFRLPCRMELMKDLLSLSQHSILSGSSENFARYLCWSGLDYILIDTEYERQSGVKAWLTSAQPRIAAESERWTLYEGADPATCANQTTP